MTVRVCAGWLKGSVLATPAGGETRPTGARVREAVMDMLQGVVPDAKVLDLFAGSGAFAIEALSRGAASAVLVENNPKTLTVLRENLALVSARAAKNNITYSSWLLAKDLKYCLTQIGEYAPFDLVWADPPYSDVAYWVAQLWPHLPAMVHTQGHFILESDEVGSTALSTQLADDGANWYLKKQKRYGLTFINILQRQTAATGEKREEQ